MLKTNAISAGLDAREKLKEAMKLYRMNAEFFDAVQVSDTTGVEHNSAAHFQQYPDD